MTVMLEVVPIAVVVAGLVVAEMETGTVVAVIDSSSTSHINILFLF